MSTENLTFLSNSVKPHYLQLSKLDHMKGNELKISHLPSDFNKDEFRDFFSLHGKIQSISFDHSQAMISYFDHRDAQNTAMDYYGPHAVLGVLYGGKHQSP